MPISWRWQRKFGKVRHTVVVLVIIQKEIGTKMPMAAPDICCPASVEKGFPITFQQIIQNPLPPLKKWGKPIISRPPVRVDLSVRLICERTSALPGHFCKAHMGHSTKGNNEEACAIGV